MTLEMFEAFLGLCTLISFGLLVISTLFVTLARGTLMAMHGRLFGVADEGLPGIYFRYLAGWKLLILTFNFTPWLALQVL